MARRRNRKRDTQLTMEDCFLEGWSVNGVFPMKQPNEDAFNFSSLKYGKETYEELRKTIALQNAKKVSLYREEHKCTWEEARASVSTVNWRTVVSRSDPFALIPICFHPYDYMKAKFYQVSIPKNSPCALYCPDAMESLIRSDSDCIKSVIEYGSSKTRQNEQSLVSAINKIFDVDMAFHNYYTVSSYSKDMRRMFFTNTLPIIVSWCYAIYQCDPWDWSVVAMKRGINTSGSSYCIDDLFADTNERNSESEHSHSSRLSSRLSETSSLQDIESLFD